MFGKLEATASVNTSGIGLGLSICKKIVEMFDGRIAIDEDYRIGTKFKVSIKAHDEEWRGEHSILEEDNIDIRLSQSNIFEDSKEQNHESIHSRYV